MEYLNSGKPLYHGTISHFDQFNKSPIGIYLTDDVDIAKSYGMGNYVMVRATANSVYELDFFGGQDNEETSEHLALEDECRYAFQNGWDAVVAYNTFDGENEFTQYVVKDPSQIEILGWRK